MADEAASGFVTVGLVVRPQGHRGEVVVHPETDFGEERFRPGEVLNGLLDGAPRPFRVVTSRPHDGRWVVRFEGVSNMDEAEALRGAELRVPEHELKPLEPGRYYTHDLVGCVTVDGAGQAIGPVTRVDLMAGIPLLVIDSARYGEVLVPLAASICRSVDVAGKRIEIAPPPGLLELNATSRSGAGA